MGNTVFGAPVFYVVCTALLFVLAGFMLWRAWIWLVAGILPALFALFAYLDMTTDNEGIRYLIQAGVKEGCLMEPRWAFGLWLSVCLVTLGIWAKKQFLSE